MNEQQKKTLAELNCVLVKATEDGTLDCLAGFQHPDITNNFCDLVEMASKTELSTEIA